MRVVVRALLPLGEGVVLDPFMGSGSTLAAAGAVGYQSIGVELDEGYFQLAERAIPHLAALYPNLRGDDLDAVAEGTTLRVQPAGQMDFALTA